MWVLTEFLHLLKFWYYLRKLVTVVIYIIWNIGVMSFKLFLFTIFTIIQSYRKEMSRLIDFCPCISLCYVEAEWLSNIRLEGQYIELVVLAFIGFVQLFF